MRIARRVIVISSALLAAACSGGGSSKSDYYNGSTELVALDSSNVESVTAVASATALDFAGGSYGSFPLITAAAPGDLASARAVTRSALRTIRSVRTAALTQQATVACDVSGSMTVSARDADGDSATTQAGDYVSISFKSCNDGYQTTSGSVTMTVTASDGAPFMDSTLDMSSGFAYGMKLTMNELVTTGTDGSFHGTDGDLALTLIWDATTHLLTQSIHGSSIASRAGTGSTIEESSLVTAVPGTPGYALTSIEEYTDASASAILAQRWGATARMCSLEIAGCVDLQIDPLFRQLVSDPYPSAGKLRLTAKGGAYVELTAVDGATGAVTVSWELDGQAPVPDATVATSWTCLNAPGSCP